jgi:hypothetical protein
LSAPRWSAPATGNESPEIDPAPLAQAPNIGDCLVEPLHAWQPPDMPRAGACGARKYGEVVAVMPGSLKQYLESVNDYSADDPDATEGASVRTGAAFLGLPSDHAGQGTVPPTWYPSTHLGVQVVQPDAIARKFGADRTACVVEIFSERGDAAPSYAGTLAAVTTTFEYPPEAAICWPHPPPVGGLGTTSCRTPHPVEEFGSIWDVDPTAAGTPSLRSSCVELVSRMTGMSDPTADGALLIRIADTGESRTTTIPR